MHYIQPMDVQLWNSSLNQGDLPPLPVKLQDIDVGAINHLLSPTKFKRHFSELSISIEDEYSRGGYSGLLLDSQQNSTVGEYLKCVGDNPDSRKICIQHPLPSELAAELCKVKTLKSWLMDVQAHTSSHFFLGNFGNKSNLHTDLDYRGFILFQLFGQKRVIAFPPKESQKLAPMKNFSGLCLDNFNTADLSRFLKFANGTSAMIGAGEGIYIPAGWWHHISYYTTSASVNFRFQDVNMDAIIRLIQQCHANYKALGIVSELSRLTNRSRLKTVEKALADVVHDLALSGQRKFDRVEALYDQLYAEYCPDHYQTTTFQTLYCHQASHWWREELESGGLYPASNLAVGT